MHAGDFVNLIITHVSYHSFTAISSLQGCEVHNSGQNISLVGSGPEAKTRGGIIVSPAYTYKECVKYWCSRRINPDLKKLGAHGGPG